jgi:exonuclease III
MDMRFGTWNVKSLYRASSLRTVGEEISKYKLDLVGVQEVRWGGGGTEPACEYTFFYGNLKRTSFSNSGGLQICNSIKISMQIL